MANKGWLRLWFVGCVAMVSITLLNVFTFADLIEETSGADRCVPGTVDTYSDNISVRTVEPTQAQAREAFARIRREEPTLSDDEVGLRVGLEETKTIYKKQTYFSCTSYAYVLRSILVSLLMCLFPALVFVAVRWVWRGFRGV